MYLQLTGFINYKPTYNWGHHLAAAVGGWSPNCKSLASDFASERLAHAADAFLVPHGNPKFPLLTWPWGPTVGHIFGETGLIA